MIESNDTVEPSDDDDRDSDYEAQWHIEHELLTQVDGLQDAAWRLWLLDDFVYLVFCQVLEMDDAAACLRLLLRENARVEHLDEGLRIQLQAHGTAIQCRGSGRLTARALEALMEHAGRPIPHPAALQPDCFPGKQG